MPLIAFMIYFGAFLIPVCYFAVTGRSGAAKKGVLIGLALHIFWSLAVYGFIYYSWRAGYREYYWGWALMIPVNLISAIYYVGFLILKGRRGPNQTPEPTPTAVTPPAEKESCQS
jgi:hypothetical protein